LQGRAILVLEDEPLIRADVVNMMRSAGAQVHTAGTVREALALIRRHKINSAVLDIKIDESDCRPVFARLMERRIPIVFHTGYPCPFVSKTWPESSIVTKPSRSGALVEECDGALCSHLTRPFFSRALLSLIGRSTRMQP
jgi:CheY-like chemotaxis protein